MNHGTTVDERRAVELLDTFVEHGGTWIDTADCYSFWNDPSGVGGASEHVLGSGLAARPGAPVKISTKVRHQPLVPHRWPESAGGSLGRCDPPGDRGQPRAAGRRERRPALGARGGQDRRAGGDRRDVRGAREGRHGARRGCVEPRGVAGGAGARPRRRARRRAVVGGAAAVQLRAAPTALSARSRTTPPTDAHVAARTRAASRSADTLRTPARDPASFAVRCSPTVIGG
jgi:hypothetical protein